MSISAKEILERWLSKRLFVSGVCYGMANVLLSGRVPDMSHAGLAQLVAPLETGAGRLGEGYAHCNSPQLVSAERRAAHCAQVPPQSRLSAGDHRFDGGYSAFLELLVPLRRPERAPFGSSVVKGSLGLGVRRKLALPAQLLAKKPMVGFPAGFAVFGETGPEPSKSVPSLKFEP